MNLNFTSMEYILSRISDSITVIFRYCELDCVIKNRVVYENRLQCKRSYFQLSIKHRASRATKAKQTRHKKPQKIQYFQRDTGGLLRHILPPQMRQKHIVVSLKSSSSRI